MFLHGGWGAEHSYLIDAVKGLEDKFHFIFYDQRGSLLSPAKPENISVQKHIADLEKLRKVLGFKKLNLIGHSQGTYLAMRYLQEYPQNVEKMVLIGSLYPKNGSYLSKKELEMENESNANFLKFIPRAETVKAYQEIGLSKDAARAIAKLQNKTKEEIEAIKKSYSDLSIKEQAQLDKVSNASANLYHVERWRQKRWVKPFFKEISGTAAYKTMDQNYNFVSVIRKHSFPITLLNGTHEQLDFGNRRWKYISKDIPNVKMIVIEKAGHIIWIDQPEIFRNELEKALSG